MGIVVALVFCAGILHRLRRFLPWRLSRKRRAQLSRLWRGKRTQPLRKIL